MKKKEDEEFEELWSRGEEIAISRGKGKGKSTVFSMKMDRELLKVLVEQARDKGIGPSTFARELIEEGLLARGKEIPTESVIDILRSRIKDAERNSVRKGTAT